MNKILKMVRAFLFILFSGMIYSNVSAQKIKIKNTNFILNTVSNKALDFGIIELKGEKSDYRFVLLESSYPDVIKIDFKSGTLNISSSAKLKTNGIEQLTFKVLINDQKRVLSLVEEFKLSLNSNLKSISIVGSPENDFDVYITDQINHGIPKEDFTFKEDKRFGAFAWTSQGSLFEAYSFLKIDLSFIRSGTKISHAILNLKGVDHMSTVENAVYIQKVTENWDINTVTWKNQPSSTESNRIKLELTNNKTKDYSIDITAFVKQWVKSPSTNFGLLFKIDQRINYASLYFGSCNHPNATKRPSLIIYYE